MRVAHTRGLRASSSSERRLHPAQHVNHLLVVAASALVACQDARPRALEAQFELVELLPERERFLRPLWFGATGPGAREHVVVEQAGLIWTFDLARDERGNVRASEPRELLDLSAAVTTRGNEEGLLGLAFHPRFAENGRVFLYYSPREKRVTRLVELHAPSRSPLALDEASERTLLEIDQPYSNHNGGALLFGPDGKLYLGVGDGGAAGDPHEKAQDLRSLLGKVLRIDVDRATEEQRYAVPDDNPFADSTEHDGARGEIWALGLRNPWRMAFDVDGRLWCGDVGQDAYEEVDIVERGGNYGWPRREAFVEFRPQGREGKRGPGKLLDPLLAYPHREGKSITGGLVYRGKRVPSLAGKYVFADYESNRVWAIPADARDGTGREQIAVAPSVSSFGTDAWGELYLCCFDGRVRAVVPR